MDYRQRQLLRQAEKKVQRGKFAVYGFGLALMSIIYGAYIHFNGGYLVNTIDARFNFITEDIVVFGTLLAGLIKIYGVLFNNGWAKRIGIIVLSFVWAVIFMLSSLWAIGAGYPSPNFIIYGFVLFICLRVSHKGDFN